MDRRQFLKYIGSIASCVVIPGFVNIPNSAVPIAPTANVSSGGFRLSSGLKKALKDGVIHIYAGQRPGFVDSVSGECLMAINIGSGE